MKLISSTFLIGTALFTASCATSQTVAASLDQTPASVETTETRSEPISRSAPHSKERFVETYDADGDGKVTHAEFLAERKSGYDIRDANKDGEVHEEEYVSEYEGGIDQAYVRFNVLDDDEDGNMTLSEFNASGENIFKTLDTNGDGTIDETDTETHY